jgi:putative transposase
MEGVYHMEQITITAKIQISVSDTDKVLLNDTMSAYSSACNYVSDYIFQTHDLKQFSLNKVLYATVREKFSLKSQMAQSVFKTVIARYKTILENQGEWIKPSFKKPQYDLVWNRDYSLTKNCFSINTLNGRVKLPYFAEGMSKYFDHSVYEFGTAKLVNKHGKYFLHIPVTYDVGDSNISDICNVVGIDRGINFVVATYDSADCQGICQ